MDEIKDGYLANGYAKSIKMIEGKERFPNMSEAISGVIAEDQNIWEQEYLE